MNNDPSQVTFSRREFSALMMTFFSIMGLAGTARAGIDKDGKPTKGRRRPGVLADPDEAKGIALEINFPAEEGWRFIYPRDRDEWVRLALDADEICPRMNRQLSAARAAKRGTKILARVNGDAAVIFKGVEFFQPGEQAGDECSESDAKIVSSWRIYGEGRNFRRIRPDNTSWWQERLKWEGSHGLYERSFHEVWLKENDEDRGTNYGCGLAQDLMLGTHHHEKPEQLEPWLSNRERKILATFVQWLGTNCGLSFLYEVTRKAGKPQYLAR